VPGQLTYPEVGATRSDDLPAGYRHVRRHEPLGTGVDAFRRAAAALAGWRLQRDIGMRIPDGTPAPAVGVLFTGRLAGLIGIPGEVVWVVDEPRRYGFAYGTRPGHPETGEEAFDVTLDDADRVWLDIRAFSRPARWYSRLGGPLTYLAQELATARYVAVARRAASQQ
jgi:uncharacterized protein (UPF0548 family)